MRCICLIAAKILDQLLAGPLQLIRYIFSVAQYRHYLWAFLKYKFRPLHTHCRNQLPYKTLVAYHVQGSDMNCPVLILIDYPLNRLSNLYI